MGYRIEYGSSGTTKTSGYKRDSGMWAGILIMLLVVGAVVVKVMGLPWIQEVLLPGDPEVTAAALEGMVQDLKAGESFVDAVTAFCQEIVNGAQ